MASAAVVVGGCATHWGRWRSFGCDYGMAIRSCICTERLRSVTQTHTHTCGATARGPGWRGQTDTLVAGVRDWDSERMNEWQGRRDPIPVVPDQSTARMSRGLRGIRIRSPPQLHWWFRPRRRMHGTPRPLPRLRPPSVDAFALSRRRCSAYNATPSSFLTETWGAPAHGSRSR